MNNQTICNNNNNNNIRAKQLSDGDPAYNKKDFSNLNWLVYTYFTRNDYDACKKLIRHQLSTLHNLEYLHFIHGIILRNEGKHQESLNALQKALSGNRNDPNCYKEIGKTFLAMHNQRKSLELFLKAETLTKRVDYELYHYIGELLLKNVGQPSRGLNEAKDYLHRAVINGKKAESFHQLAQIYIKENEFSKAIEILEGYLETSPNNVDIIAEIAILYLKVNDPQTAYAKLIDATELEECNANVFLALGAIVQSKNDYDGALNCYKKVNVEHRDGPELWSNLGLCFFKKQKYVAAMACLQKAVWLSPMNFNVLFNYALVYLSAQQYASAFHTLAEAINLRPEQAECYMLLGICLANLNDPSNARLAFERSTILAGVMKNPLVYLNAAIYSWQMGDAHNLAIYLDKFLRVSDSKVVHRELVVIGNHLRDYLPRQRGQQMIDDQVSDEAVVDDDVEIST